MILLELKCIINSPLLHAEGRFVVQTAPQPASGYVTAQKCTLYTRVCFQYNRVKGVVGSLLISQTYLSTSSSTRKCYFAAHQKQILDLVRTEGFEANTAAGCHCHMLLITHIQQHGTSSVPPVFCSQAKTLFFPSPKSIQCLEKHPNLRSTVQFVFFLPANFHYMYSSIYT